MEDSVRRLLHQIIKHLISTMSISNYYQMAQETIHNRVTNRKANQIQIVTNVIRNEQIFSSDIELSRHLPIRIPYAALKMILIGLERQNKITRDKDGSIVWIYADSQKSRKSLEDSVPLR